MGHQQQQHPDSTQSYKVCLGLCHHLSRPTLQVLDNEPLEAGGHQNLRLPSGPLQAALGKHQGAAADKLPGVSAAIFSMCQLQRVGCSDAGCRFLTSCLLHVAKRWGGSILCLLLTEELPLDLSIQSQPSLSSLPPASGETLWPVIVRISCNRKGERREAKLGGDNSREATGRVRLNADSKGSSLNCPGEFR